MQVRSFSYAHAHQGTPCSAALARILSSMSVTLRTSVTPRPCPRSSHRRSTSKTSAARTWPMCGGPWTVSPQTYMEACPARRGVKSRTARAAVSYRRRLTARSLRTWARAARSALETDRRPLGAALLRRADHEHRCARDRWASQVEGERQARLVLSRGDVDRVGGGVATVRELPGEGERARAAVRGDLGRHPVGGGGAAALPGRRVE